MIIYDKVRTNLWINLSKMLR